MTSIQPASSLSAGAADLHALWQYPQSILAVLVSAGAADLAALGHLFVPPLSSDTAPFNQLRRMLVEPREHYNKSFRACSEL